MPCRFCCQKRGGLLPHRFTIAVLIAETWADCSLWHFPSPRGVRPLAGILLCGARTFLCAIRLRSDRPASFKSNYRMGKPGSPDFSCGMTLIRCAAKSQPSQQHCSRPSCRRPPAKLSSAQANRAATARPDSAFIEAAAQRRLRSVCFNCNAALPDMRAKKEGRFAPRVSRVSGFSFLLEIISCR